MNQILAIVFLAFLPICAGLNCYYCLSGCNDPFSATAAGVSQTGSNATNLYCMKSMANNIVTRMGAPACTAVPFIAGVGIACCQTDLCNGAQGIYQISLLTMASFLIALFKLY